VSFSQWKLNGQSWSNLVKVGQTVNSGQSWSNLVKYSNLVKDWSNERALTANIDIFGRLYKFGLHD